MLVVANEVPPSRGGMERWLADLVGAVSSRHEVAVACPASGDRGHLERIGAKAVFPTPRFSRESVEDCSSLIPIVLEAVRQHRPDLVHLGQTGFVVLGPPLAQEGIPFVLTAHGNDVVQTWLWEPATEEEKQRKRRELLPTVNRVAAVSRFTAERILEAGARGPVSIISPAVDIDRFLPGDKQEARRWLGLPRTRPVLLSVARLVKRKGHEFVLSALPEISSHDPLYVVAGIGPELEPLQRQARAMALEDRVRFLGRVSEDELPLLYRAADLFVLPAYERVGDQGRDYEGFGIVFLEAAASAVPSVAVRSGGVPDAIQDGETGILVPPGDPVALTRALEELLSDPDRAKRLGENGSQRAREMFSLDRFGERYDHLYREVVQNRGG